MDEYKSKKNENENAATDYESLLQKEEASIRQHISYENQIKIEYEKLMDKYEMVELENKLILFQLVSKKNFISFIYIGKAKRRI
jgi:predicted ribosome-associated RNA-binding protein Tma20